MDTDELFEKFKCNVCEVEVKGRTNFMTHKKKNHPENLPTCEQFSRNKCSRSDQECWYEHPSTEINSETHSPAKSAEKLVFREVLGNSFPPDQLGKMMEMVRLLCSKVENMEERFRELMN